MAYQGPKSKSGESSSRPRHHVASSRKGSLSFANSNFTTLDASSLQQTNVVVIGDDGSGKTAFGVRFAPSPIALINFDNRAATVVDEATNEGKTVQYSHYDLPEVPTTNKLDNSAKDECKKILRAVLNDIEVAVNESLRGNVRTICLDTATELSDLATLSVRGHLESERDYGRSKNFVNQTWHNIYRMVRKGKAHLVLVAREQEVWENDVATGIYKPRGSEVIKSGCDFAVRSRLIPKKKKVKGKRACSFQLDVIKAGPRIMEMGASYKESDWGGEDGLGPFVHCGMRMYPNVDLEVWI